MAVDRGGSRDRDREQRRLEREEEQRRQADKRARTAAEKEVKRRHVEEAHRRAARKTESLEQRVSQLEDLLVAGLQNRTAFRVWRRSFTAEPLDLGR